MLLVNKRIIVKFKDKIEMVNEILEFLAMVELSVRLFTRTIFSDHWTQMINLLIRFLLCFHLGLASQFGEISNVCPFPLSIMICRKYIVTNIKKNWESKKSFVAFHLQKEKGNIMEILNVHRNTEFINKIVVNTSARNRLLSLVWNWCIFCRIVLKSKFLNIMNALVEIKLTQYLNEGQMLRKRMKQLNSLSRPTRNRKLSEHLCLLKPPYFRDLRRINN